jgi:hypothetical protein
MYLILFLVGIALAFAGAVLIQLAAPAVDLGALFTAGVVAFVGGLIIIGVAAAVRALSRIAERLEIQPLPLPPVASVSHDDPAPRPARPAQPAAVAPVPRPSLLGWFGRPSAPAPVSAARSGSPPEAAAPVDLSPLTRVPEEPRPAPAPPPKSAPVAPKPAAKPVAPAAGTPETTVYKSGVIDGMAYTLFMDGSIEAELPQGRVKFASVDELQKYLTTRT